MIEFTKLSHNDENFIKVETKLKVLNLKYDKTTFAVMVLKKDETILAKVAVDIEEIYLRILYLELFDKNENLEFILRSLCAYAQNRSKFTIKCENVKLQPIIKNIPNYTVDGIVYIDTLKLVCGNCK